MKVYKGTDKDMKCRGFQYKLGEAAVKAAIVDGEKIKAGTWYQLKNGEFVEVE
nr:MAG: hypothetical protein [Bacteriophage sp.]